MERTKHVGYIMMGKIDIGKRTSRRMMRTGWRNRSLTSAVEGCSNSSRRWSRRKRRRGNDEEERREMEKVGWKEKQASLSFRSQVFWHRWKLNSRLQSTSKRWEKPPIILQIKQFQPFKNRQKSQNSYQISCSIKKITKTLRIILNFAERKSPTVLNSSRLRN